MSNNIQIAHAFYILMGLTVIVLLQQNLTLTSSLSSSSSSSRQGILVEDDSVRTTNNYEQRTQILPVMLSGSSNQEEKNNGWHPVYVFHGIIDDNDTNDTSTSNEKEEETKKQPIDVIPYQSSGFKKNFDYHGSQVQQDIIVTALMSHYITHQEETKSNNINNNNNNKRLLRNTDNSYYSLYFIDLAANDAIQLSNTLNLENIPSHVKEKWDPFNKQRWAGLCIEPNTKYWLRLAHRKCTVVGSYVGVPPKDDGLMLTVTDESREAHGGIVGNDMDNKKNNLARHQASTEQRAVVSFNTILKQFAVPYPYIDYLSLDVEGAEYLVMENFPFDKYIIRILTVERPKDQLKKLLKDNGYIYVMTLISWGETLWVHESFIISHENDLLQEDNNNSPVKNQDTTLTTSTTTTTTNIDESCGMNLTQLQTLVHSLCKSAIYKPS